MVAPLLGKLEVYPKLVYSRSCAMDRQQTYRGVKVFYVEWTRGTLIYDISSSLQMPHTFENVGFETKFGGPRQKNLSLDMCLTLSLVSRLVPHLFWLKTSPFSTPIINKGFKPSKTIEISYWSWKHTILPNKRGMNLETKLLKVKHMLKLTYLLPWPTKLRSKPMFSNIGGLHMGFKPPPVDRGGRVGRSGAPRWEDIYDWMSSKTPPLRQSLGLVNFLLWTFCSNMLHYFKSYTIYVNKCGLVQIDIQGGYNFH